MNTRKWLVSTGCFLLALILLVLPAKQVRAEVAYNEATVLDLMADSWIQTCQDNIKYCAVGLDLYILGQPNEHFKDNIKKQFLSDIKEGYKATSAVYCSVDVGDLCQALGSDSLRKDIDTFMTTDPNSDSAAERLLHNQAKNSINKTVKEGEIAEGVDLMDMIKENYSFFIGMITCEVARDFFQDAKAATDLETKRQNMMYGAIMGIVGCEMSVADADAVAKNEGKAWEEILVSVAETGIDLVSDIVPQVGIAYDVITITADVGIKTISINRRVDRVLEYMENPDLIEGNISDYLDALSNQHGLFTYEISDLEVVMETYKGYFAQGDAYKKVVIPETMYALPVTAFSGTFAKALDITEVTIPSGIRTRGLSHVIEDCDSLEKVYFNALACRGQYLFGFIANCDSDFKVIFGPGVTMIPDRFILKCGITEIQFPEGVTTIYDGAVIQCNQLKSVTIPSTVTNFEVEYGASAVISKCPNLETVYYNAVDAENGYYNAVLGGCGNDAEEMQVIFGSGVKSIPSTFIINCGVKTVAFPEGLTLIRDYAISGCTRLETLTIPSTVTRFPTNYVCDYVFSDLDQLKTLNYNAKNAEGYLVWIFYKLTGSFTVNIGAGVTQIPENFMYNCGITSVTFPEGLQTIGELCLQNCDSLETVTVPSTVTEIGRDFIADCDNLDTVYYNAVSVPGVKVSMIKNNGNVESPHMKVVIGPEVSTIPTRFISNCGITEMIYPEGVTTINSYSLIGCTALEKVVFPSTVTHMGSYIMDECEALREMYFYPENVERLSTGGYLFYESGNTSGMKLYLGQLQTLPNSFMYKCGVESVTVPKTMTQIPGKAFVACKKLTELNLDAPITKISGNAFEYCSALTYVHIPEGVTELGTSAFNKCTSLTEIIIPQSVRKINGSAFYGCTALSKVIYCGNPVQWCDISISTSNSNLKNAPRAYHYREDPTRLQCDICGREEDSHWTLTKDCEISYTMTRDLYIQLNGYDLTGTLITNGYRVYGMDAVTDGYARKGIGYFTCVDENGEAVVPQSHVMVESDGGMKRYLCIGNDKGYSFHRFYMGITKVTLQTADCGFGYKAQIYGSDWVLQNLDSFGFRLKLDTREHMVTRSLDASKLKSGKEYALVLRNYDVDTFGETKVHAQVFVRLPDGTEIDSATVSYSMRDMLETLNTYPLTAAQKLAIKALIAQYPVTKSWKTENLFGFSLGRSCQR